MKFCKNLQRVVDIADPEWAPYWMNYKMLKKLINQLPSLVATEAVGKVGVGQVSSRPTSPSESVSTSVSAARQHRGDKTSEVQSGGNKSTESASGTAAVEARAGSSGATAAVYAAEAGDGKADTQGSTHRSNIGPIGKSPGEIAFFKLLHAEFKKATHFFERAQQEYVIREDRVMNGIEIMKQPNAIMVGEKWSLLAKSIYRLYKDLLLLETFAIMTYCGFSKILKKHDKVTGYSTRNAFMANVVNNANFSTYPKVLHMISRCEQLYEEVSERLIQDGKKNLYEDERLFINMIHRLNEQVIDSEEDSVSDDKKRARRRSSSPEADVSSPQQITLATSTLRELVQENDAIRSAREAFAGLIAVDSDDEAHPHRIDCLKAQLESEAEAPFDKKRKAHDHDGLSGKRVKNEP